MQLGFSHSTVLPINESVLGCDEIEAGEADTGDWNAAVPG